MCSKICGYEQGNNGNITQKTFAAASKNDSVLINAASGGLFTVMAESVLKDQGVVCGSAMIRHENSFDVKHIFVDNEKELKTLAGSKYVKSSTDGVFREAEQILKTGRMLLFSGTPC